ncbi:DUF3482 domain-containing protein [Aliidiomarina sedimenti]|uniref:DUF3482 domain-containing protein n=1 Tax=Aliidiomarina sedimenti TaxID=1933879 RepID=A0ABY0C3S4_9GAMM|nr:GTPase/DUF3482 domain-containing protein [Aliidiomarina sedimenti]RUO32207.1 DUF3482 domain-containing protein [Aliidiomarina sedimenti]
MASHPLKLAIVGHTNVGKTSLLRTLARDSLVGVVAASPSTTQQVVAGRIRTDDGEQIELFDTPGLEDGIGLFDYMSRLQTATNRHDGPALLQSFLSSPEAKGQYAQEAKVIAQLLASDAALYVIDARDPVLPKFQDELAVLSKSARPILPVLNFTASKAHNAEAWHQALARVNLHAWVEFDSVTPQLDGEITIYQRLQTLLPAWRDHLQRFIHGLASTQSRRYHNACQLIAELMIDCAALRERITPQADDALKQHINSLQQHVRRREQSCVHGLLKLYNFTPESVKIDAIAIQNGRWELDLFSPQSLRQFGIKASGGAATGAAAGAGIDVLLLGSSMGAGTLIGAAAGGLWQSWRNMGKRLQQKWRGYRELTVDDAVLKLLLSRQLQLLQVLTQRAHAATQPDAVDSERLYSRLQQQEYLWELIQRARSHPEWSSVLAPSFIDSEARQHLHTKLTEQLTKVQIPSK